MNAKEIRDFISENYYKQIRFSKEESIVACKQIKMYLILVMLKNILNHFQERKIENN